MERISLCNKSGHKLFDVIIELPAPRPGVLAYLPEGKPPVDFVWDAAAQQYRAGSRDSAAIRTLMEIPPGSEAPPTSIELEDLAEEERLKAAALAARVAAAAVTPAPAPEVVTLPPLAAPELTPAAG